MGDRLMKNLSPRTHEISTRRDTLPVLIQKNSADYLLIAPEEVETLISDEGLSNEGCITLTMQDIPEDNKRYLMFSMSVSDDMITRISESIAKIVGPDLSNDFSK